MITAAQIKELREKTGISVALCKKALEESKGDIAKALKILSRESEALADKKSGRELNAGALDVYLHTAKNIAVLVDLRSETDFVSKNEAFTSLAHDLAIHIAASSPSSVEELMEQNYVTDPALKIRDLIRGAVQKFGENIRIARFTRYSLSDSISG